MVTVATDANTPEAQQALRALQPWVQELQADWATMLTRVAATADALPDPVASMLRETTEHLDVLAANVAAYIAPRGGAS